MEVNSDLTIFGLTVGKNSFSREICKINGLHMDALFSKIKMSRRQ